MSLVRVIDSQRIDLKRESRRWTKKEKWRCYKHLPRSWCRIDRSIDYSDGGDSRDNQPFHSHSCVLQIAEEDWEDSLVSFVVVHRENWFDRSPWDRFFPCCAVTVRIGDSVTQLSASVSQFGYCGQMRRNCGWLRIVVIHCNHNYATVPALRLTTCSAITTVSQYPLFTSSAAVETKSNQRWRLLIPFAVLISPYFHVQRLR